MGPHRREPLSSDRVGELRQELLEHLDGLQELVGKVSAALEDASGSYAQTRDILASGGRLSDLEQVVDPIRVRSNLVSSLVELEHMRHRAQSLIFRLLCEEGRSMTDIANVWGISRQLVSRLVNEPISPPASFGRGEARSRRSPV